MFWSLSRIVCTKLYGMALKHGKETSIVRSVFRERMASNLAKFVLPTARVVFHATIRENMSKDIEILKRDASQWTCWKRNTSGTRCYVEKSAKLSSTCIRMREKWIVSLFKVMHKWIQCSLGGYVLMCSKCYTYESWKNNYKYIAIQLFSFIIKTCMDE